MRPPPNVVDVTSSTLLRGGCDIDHVRPDRIARQRVRVKAAGSRGGARGRAGRRVADGDRAHRAPARGQVEGPGRRHPGRTASTRPTPSPGSPPASATRKFCTAGAHRDDEHLPLGRDRRCVRVGVRGRPSPGRAPRGTARRAAQSPRRVRRAICSSVNPSPRRSAIQASRIASSSAARAASDDTITNRHGVAVMRRRGGQRRGDRPPYGGGVDRLPVNARTVRAGTAARRRDAEPEHVLGRRHAPAPRAPGPSASVTRPAQPAHDRDRHLPRLALDQVAGGGDLVGDRGDRDLEGVAVRVRLAPRRSSQRQHPGRPDRRVGQARPPRPPMCR